MAWHVDTIKDVSNRPWWEGSAADYRARVREIAQQILTWQGTHEDIRYEPVQRRDAVTALGLSLDESQLVGDALYHLRDQGFAQVEKKGRAATDWYWRLTSRGLDVTAQAYVKGHEA